MLNIGLKYGQNVYVGSACIVRLNRIEPDGYAEVVVWDNGTETRYEPKFGDLIPLPGVNGRAMRVEKRPGSRSVVLSFDVPRSVPIAREKFLSVGERRKIKLAAGMNERIDRTQ